MLPSLYDTVDSPEVQGKDITIPRLGGAVYLSREGEVVCFMGVFSRDREEVCFSSWPYYLEGKHSAQCQKQVRGFFRIERGCILLTRFLDLGYHSEAYYKKLNHHLVRLPVPNSCWFGVERWIETEGSRTFEEDQELTRACFGLTYEELAHVVEVYAELLGVSNGYVQYPRITRSIKSQNFCDITGAWIPDGFPYIAFNDSQYAYSHVSLHGFYRHLGALLSMGSHTKGTEMFENALTKEIVSRLRPVDDYLLGTEVTRETIYSDESI